MAYASWSVVFGEQPSAAKWNILGTNDASFNDGTGIAGQYKNLLTVDSNPYKFSAYRNAAWTAGSSAWAKVALDTELYDTNSNFDSVTNNRYVAPVAGFYFFSGAASSFVGNNSLISTALYKNGSVVNYGGAHITGAAGSVENRPSVSALLQLSVSDYVELYHYGGGGAGSTGSSATYLMGFLLCRT